MVSHVTPIAVLAFVIVLREIFTNILIVDLVILKAGNVHREFEIVESTL